MSKARSDTPEERALHWYPWWSPRFWHGMPLRVWVPLLARHRFRVAPQKLGLLATISGAAIFNSLAEPLSEARYRRQLREPPRTPPPLFIVGHWRSGTTLLHELLMLDNQFCCPNTYQCFAPGHFLLTEGLVTRALSWIIPDRRPMDDVVAGWDRPQEDEFALVNMGMPSPYLRMAFPATVPPGPAALDLTTLAPAELDLWRQAIQRFLARLAVRDPRRPVLKSPPHTARLRVLADLFPGARFLHVVRDPFVVFPSTMRLWRSLHAVQGMQLDDGAGLEEQVFTAFTAMYAAFDRDRPTLPAGSLHELRYEDLVADPAARLEQAYTALGLDGFDQMRPVLERHLATTRRYRTNTYRHDPRIVAEIAARWRPFLDRYGYDPPAPAERPAAD